MSDYCRNKAVFYPITEDDCKQLGIKDFWQLAQKYSDALSGPICHFELECMVDYDGDGEPRYYLTYLLDSTYGEESGELGRSRELSPKEQLKYNKLFEEHFPGLNIDSTKFKYIDYCYYNCSEPTDYYIRPVPDDFNNEI